jgi:prolyl oligopeptidase
MKNISLLAALVLFAACQETTKQRESITVTYPTTKKVDTVDKYFGTEVPDPYRWLEDDRSEETEALVKQQNATTFGYLDKIPFR